MGCGSSSTSVQTFNDPEANQHNRRHQNEHSTVKAPSRQSLSASKTRHTDGSSSSPHVPARQSSATSSSSKKIKTRNSSANSAISRRSSRSNSANTKVTYTIQRTNSDIANKETVNDSEKIGHDENENVDTDALNAEEERKREEANKQYEEIQKQTFLTDNSKDVQNTQTVFEVPEPEKEIDKAELHEEKARVKEENRSNYSYDKVIKDTVEEFNLSPILIPEMDAEQTIGNYTVDDIVEHNNEVASDDWFKYGRKVYSYQKMRPIFQARFDEIKDTYINPYKYKDVDAETMGHRNLVYACNFMITRAECSKMLAACHVGNCVELPRDEYMARMKQSVEYVLEDPGDSEYMKDYKSQCSRWLSDYPYSKVDNDKMDVNVDPNAQPFPLPKDIQADPCTLRKWIEEWEIFDLVVPEEGCWQQLPTLDVDWGNSHEVFAEAVQSHDDPTLAPLDMDVDGDVAWIEIDLDIFKNDVTTPDQDAVWKTRASRTNLTDPVWQAGRRKQLGEALKARYENRSMNYGLEDHARFAEVLDEHWKLFQELCEKEFIPRTGNVRLTKVTIADLHSNEIQKRGSSANSLRSDAVKEMPMVNGSALSDSGDTEVGPENTKRFEEDANKNHANENGSGRKSSDMLVLDGDASNANGVPERGSTTETMDSGLELDNFDNVSKS